MSRYKRINHKIASAFILSGWNEMDNHFGSISYRLYQGIHEYTNKRLYRYIGTQPQGWRGAYNFHSALRKLQTEYHIPLWFLKRHIRYISDMCMWRKSKDYSKGGIFIENKDDLSIFKHMAGSGNTIVYSCTIPQYISRYKEVEVVIDGEKFYKNKKCKELYVYLDMSNELGIVVSDVVNMYKNIEHRYYRRYGVDCRVCNKNVKHTEKDRICDSMAKYTHHVCPKCLRKFCDIEADIDTLMGVI
jgi:hypothetical protein